MLYGNSPSDGTNLVLVEGGRPISENGNWTRIAHKDKLNYVQNRWRPQFYHHIELHARLRTIGCRALFCIRRREENINQRRQALCKTQAHCAAKLREGIEQSMINAGDEIVAMGLYGHGANDILSDRY